jgi:ABC-2 type transport system ATP-binding protein
VLGRDPGTEPATTRERIGLLPEAFEAYENLTGREHVVSAIDAKRADDDPDEILDRVGLDPDDARRPAGEYSTGMHQRMALGVALVGDPDLLLLDEPSAGLDPNGVKLLRRIVREEADRGATVFFSSHVLAEVEKVCDRVGILDEGQLVAVDSVANLRADLEVGATVEATVDRVPERLDVEAVEGVADATVDGRTVRVSCREPTAKMRALRRIDAAATVRDVSIEDASLETLFEAYTDEDPPAGATDAAGGGGAAAVTGGERR